MQSLDLKALIFKIWSLINISFSMLSNAWYMKKSVNKTSTLFQAGLPENQAFSGGINIIKTISLFYYFNGFYFTLSMYFNKI
jgi:hypothetical protein